MSSIEILPMKSTCYSYQVHKNSKEYWQETVSFVCSVHSKYENTTDEFKGEFWLNAMINIV